MTKTKKMPLQGAFVLEIGIWSLVFVWDLVLEIWNLSLPKLLFLTANRTPSAVNRFQFISLPLTRSRPGLLKKKSRNY